MASVKFKPMLAADCRGDVAALSYPLYASPKLDGIRCCIIDGKAVTRSLKPIPNASIREALSGRQELEGLDGELINTEDPFNFQKTTSLVMGHQPDAVSKIKFVAFDNADLCLGFERRLQATEAIVSKVKQNKIYIEFIVNKYITTPDDLLEYERELLAEGYEGVMLRTKLDGRYKNGRSTLREGLLIKLKRYVQEEATIIGFEERMNNTNAAKTNELGRTQRSSAQAGKVGRDDLGAFLCKRDDGETFYCGTGVGLNDETRAEFWRDRDLLIGKTITYRYLSAGTKDKPRHPLFVGIRDARDMS